MALGAAVAAGAAVAPGAAVAAGAVVAAGAEVAAGSSVAGSTSAAPQATISAKIPTINQRDLNCNLWNQDDTFITLTLPEFVIFW